MPALLIKSGKQKGKKLLLPDNKQVVIGRDADCQIRLPTRRVSRKHCLLRTTAEGLFVSDLGSQNGTLVNDVPIREKTHLEPGDFLIIGPFVFEVVPQASPSTAGAETADESAAVTDDNILDWLADGDVIADDAIPGATSGGGRAAEHDTVHEMALVKDRSHSYLIKKEVSHIAVVRLNTKRLSAQNHEQIAGELSALVDREGHERIVLNLSDVEYIYSTALVKLTEFDSKVKAAGGELRLCNVHPVLREVFKATQLDNLFDIRTDEQSALHAFW